MKTTAQKNFILVGLKEGVSPLDVFVNTQTSDAAKATDADTDIIATPLGNLNYERLHSVDQEVNIFKSENEGRAFPLADNESLFDQEIYGTKPESERKIYRTYKIEVPPTMSSDQVINALKTHAGVSFVQKNEMNSLYFHPNDNRFTDLYGLQKIQCESAWDVSRGDDVIIAVIDTGVDYNHPDIEGNMWTDDTGKVGYDFSDKDDNPMDYHGHGSHCAGTIAAMGDNSIGVIGVAFSAQIMSVKIFPQATDDNCAAAIKYAVDHGAKILSNSWGPDRRRPSNPTVEQAIDYAHSKGAIIIFAAGNSNDDVSFYSPANYPKVISVGATDRTDSRASFSNYGNEITIAAPGVNILSLQKNTPDYTMKSGTSMACPHVAGVAAMLLSQKPELTFDEVVNCLRISADPITPDRPIGAGRLNAFKALRHIADGLA